MLAILHKIQSNEYVLSFPNKKKNWFKAKI